MNTLGEALRDYIDLRRGLEFKMGDEARLLPRFVRFMDERQEAQITARAPFSTAFDIAMVIPRSLNDPVGLAPSNFRYRSMPGAIFLARRAARISGVLPSPSVITGVRSLTGRNLRYSSMTPRQRFMALLVLALDPNQGGGLGHE